jgi:hypothetical protein
MEVGFAAQLAEGKVVCKGDSGPLCVPHRTVCPLKGTFSMDSTKAPHTKNDGFIFGQKLYIEVIVKSSRTTILSNKNIFLEHTVLKVNFWRYFLRFGVCRV